MFEVASQVIVDALTAQGIGRCMVLARMGGQFRDAMALVGAFDIHLPAPESAPSRREGPGKASVSVRWYDALCDACAHVPSLRHQDCHAG